jgi:hypothetical protein
VAAPELGLLSLAASLTAKVVDLEPLCRCGPITHAAVEVIFELARRATAHARVAAAIFFAGGIATTRTADPDASFSVRASALLLQSLCDACLSIAASPTIRQIQSHTQAQVQPPVQAGPSERLQRRRELVSAALARNRLATALIAAEASSIFAPPPVSQGPPAMAGPSLDLVAEVAADAAIACLEWMAVLRMALPAPTSYQQLIQLITDIAPQHVRLRVAVHALDAPGRFAVLVPLLQTLPLPTLLLATSGSTPIPGSDDIAQRLRHFENKFDPVAREPASYQSVAAEDALTRLAASVATGAHLSASEAASLALTAPNTPAGLTQAAAVLLSATRNLPDHARLPPALSVKALPAAAVLDPAHASSAGISVSVPDRQFAGAATASSSSADVSLLIKARRQLLLRIRDLLDADRSTLVVDCADDRDAKTAAAGDRVKLLASTSELCGLDVPLAPRPLAVALRTLP